MESVSVFRSCVSEFPEVSFKSRLFVSASPLWSRYRLNWGMFSFSLKWKMSKKQNKNSLRLKRGKKRKWEGKLEVRWTNSQRMFWCHQRRVGPAAQPGTAGTKRPGFLDALPSTRRSPLETRGSSGKHVSRQLTFPRFGKKIGEGQK